ncbi:ImmA/IrrE family metallo-endopeptidase [Myxococcota bacterium]|nr:ImmA/IrrE family metallo-endopeptidase [Myxococcota bacterium]
MSTSLHTVWKRLGFTIEEVAQAASLPLARLRTIQKDLDLIQDHEAHVLGALLGVNIDHLLDGADPAQPLASLLKGEAESLTAQARFLVAEAASVAQEVQQLRGWLGQVTGLGVVGSFRTNNDYAHPREGVPVKLAKAVRRRLGREVGPLRIYDDLLDPLGVTVLWAVLPGEIDAIAMAHEQVGAVIVANVAGRHMVTAFGRRMALAHEVCHILFDRPRMAKFARACVMDIQEDSARFAGLRGQDVEEFEEVERRARAFAAALLAPPEEVRALWADHAALSMTDRVKLVSERFGISVSATRAHLHNLDLLSMGEAVGRTAVLVTGDWETREPGPPRPPSGVPLMRSGVLLALAQDAFSRGIVSRRWAEEVVRGPFSIERRWTPTGEDPPLLARTSSAGPVVSAHETDPL